MRPIKFWMRRKKIVENEEKIKGELMKSKLSIELMPVGKID